MVSYERRYLDPGVEEGRGDWQSVSTERVQQMIEDNYLNHNVAWREIHEGKVLRSCFAEYRAIVE